MKFPLVWIVFCARASSAQDLFNYDKTSGKDFGPQDWDQVGCEKLETCPGWPAKLLGSVGWKLQKNECRWCPATGNRCGQHRQSPIDLLRERAVPGHENEHVCPDWHWIQYMDGTCLWEDMADQFEIGRHALMIHTPLKDNGDIECINEKGERKFPKNDYSKGFPDWWYLSRTDITVPSEHVQHGKRYAAEIKLSHFYEIDHYKNKLGVLSIFMQDFEGEPAWPYLDKLICKWRHEEEKKRKACGKPPAPVYKMCELYRGQQRTRNDPDLPTAAVLVPTRAPLVAPPAIPIQNHGGRPEESKFPLQLCEGHCFFHHECAPGLVCRRRQGFQAVPGCIGGESDASNSNFCVFDPHGEGYTLPGTEPVNAASATDSPSPEPAPETPAPTVRPTFGASWPQITHVGWSAIRPLGECEGHCNSDDDCLPDLICFKRNAAFEHVLGCAGGDQDASLTNYCTSQQLPNGVTEPNNPETGNDGFASMTATPTPRITSPPTKTPATIFPTNASTDESFFNNSDLAGIETIETLGVPLEIDCGAFPGVNFFRMCRQGSCCRNPRSNSQFCHESYELLGDAVESACHHCCLEEHGEAKSVGEAPLVHEEIPQLLQCSAVSGVARICRIGSSCCDDTGRGSEYCQAKYDLYSLEEMASICWYCCHSTNEIIFIESLGLGSDNATELPGIGRQTQPPEDPANTPNTSQTPMANAPTVAPESGDGVNTVSSSSPDEIDCGAFPDVNFFRMCREGSCCRSPRSNTEFCHESYELLGDAVESACLHCCLEEHGEAKSVGEAPLVHKEIPHLKQCSAVEGVARICRSGSSCCDDTGNGSAFCQVQFALYSPEEMASICWYCCHPSNEVDVDARRVLEEGHASDSSLEHESASRTRMLGGNESAPLGENDRMTHDVNGRPVILREENFEPKGMIDEDAYFEELMAGFRKRSLQEAVAENYDDVDWWPYEWLLKVGTEYYFRYEGTQTVPPCYDTAHWRVYKDPIRVAPHQMRELERLIAWRLGDDCEIDTAGKPTDDPNRVDVARPLQSFHRLHRKVFCECPNWPSKFAGDRQWCRNWQNRPVEQRLFENPYNFPSNGFEFL